MNSYLKMNSSNNPNEFEDHSSANLTSVIFTDKRTRTTSISSNRYSCKSDSTDASPLILPPKGKDSAHRRTGSHQRQRSIYYPPDTNLETILNVLKNNESPAHVRNLSDADSVVYLGPGDCNSLNNTYRQENTEKKLELQLSMIETASGSLVSTEKPPMSPAFKIIPQLGNNETTSFCRFCKKDVHTRVEFNSCYGGNILNAFSKLFTCCNYPSWMSGYIVHKCPECSLVLGKSR